MEKEALKAQLEEALEFTNKDIELVRRQAERRGIEPNDMVDQLGRSKLQPLIETRVQAILALVMLDAVEPSMTYDPTAPYYR